MKAIFITALLVILGGSIFSQSELNGRFFYNIESDYRKNDSSIIDVYVKCIYFTDTQMFFVNYCSCENPNYYYYHTEESVKKNIQRCIKDFFSIPEIDSTSYQSEIDSNPIAEDKTILVYTDSNMSDTTSANLLVYTNQLFEIYDQKLIRVKGKSTEYKAENNEFFDARCFKEFDNKYVRKNIKNN
ncbi:MAG: hypothetical protein H6600_04420 [Flavobacteriales bacterium]|nr:hypothetical protein [Flavobacteriales bacterium]